MVAMAAVQLEKVNTHSTPETEPAKVLQQLEAAAAFMGPWRETKLLMIPDNYQELAQLTAATQRAIAEGKNEHARFFIEQTVSCADKMQVELEKIKAFSQATIDCRSIGNKKRAKEMQILSENCLVIAFKDAGADLVQPTNSELIDKNPELLEYVELVLIAQAANRDLYSAEEWLEQIELTQNAATNLLRIFFKILPHSPAIAEIALEKLQIFDQSKITSALISALEDLEPEVILEFTDNLFSAIEKFGINEVAFIVRTFLLSGKYIPNLDTLIPHLATLGFDTVPLIQALIDADIHIASIEFFTYLAQEMDTSVMMKFFPQYSSVQEYVILAARAFINSYNTAVAAIRALSAYETGENYVTLSKIIWEIISVTKSNDPTLPGIIQQFSAGRTESKGVFRSFGVMLTQYDGDTPEAGWPPIADLLLKSTDADLNSCIRLFFEKYQQDGNPDLLHRAIQLIRDKFPIQRKVAFINIFLHLHLLLGQPENEELEGKMIAEVLALVDTNSYCFIDLEDPENYKIRHYLPRHPYLAQSNLPFEARRKDLLNTINPLLLDEFSRLKPQQKIKLIVQMCTLFCEAGDADTARRLFEENIGLIELLSQKQPSAELILLYIMIGRFEEVIQRDWADNVALVDEPDYLITSLCNQGFASEALQIYFHWHPQVKDGSPQGTNYNNYLGRTYFLISKLQEAKRNDLLLQLFPSLNASDQLHFASRLLYSGISAAELLSSAKIEDPGLYGSLLTILLNHLTQHGEFAVAAELFRTHADNIPWEMHATRHPRFLLAKAKAREAHQELIENTFEFSTIPSSPDDRELITALFADHSQCTIEHLAELLYQVNYSPAIIEMILTRFFGTESVESLAPLQIPQAHDENRLLQRLAGVFTPSECAFIVQQGWDTALLSKIWQDGYPNLTKSQIENLGLMLNLEKKRPGIIKYLSRIFGINCFSRVPEELWLAMFDDRQSDKQWGLVILSQVDHNGALNQVQPAWEHLYRQIMHSHTLVFCEAISLESIRTALMRAAVHYGKKNGRRKPQEDFKSAFIIVDWHGSKSGGTLAHSPNGRVDSEIIREIAGKPMTLALRTNRIQSNPVPFLSLGCQTGVKFVATVTQELSFSEGRGPELSSNIRTIEPRYAPDGKKLISLIPTFHAGKTLTYSNTT